MIGWGDSVDRRRLRTESQAGRGRLALLLVADDVQMVLPSSQRNILILDGWNRGMLMLFVPLCVHADRKQIVRSFLCGDRVIGLHFVLEDNHQSLQRRYALNF